MYQYNGVLLNYAGTYGIENNDSHTEKRHLLYWIFALKSRKLKKELM